MYAPIKNHTAAVDAVTAPTVHGTPGAQHPALNKIRFSQQFLPDHFFNNGIILIPAAILMDGKQPPGFFGNRDHVFQLCRVERNRLFANDILTRAQALNDQWLMKIIGNRNGDQIHLRVRQKLFLAAVNKQAVFLSLVTSLLPNVKNPLDFQRRNLLPDILYMPRAHPAVTNNCQAMTHI